jgi:DNA-binding NtrC family response regulator
MMRQQDRQRKQARTLIVDFRQPAGQGFSAILGDQGYEVATAFSGEEAVAKAAQFFPDLLLSEVCMDPMGGVAAATRIANLLPDWRVLFLSGSASMADIFIAAPKHLAYSFTNTPLHPPDLLNSVAYMLSAVSTVDESTCVDTRHKSKPRGAGTIPADIDPGIGKSAMETELASSL